MDYYVDFTGGLDTNTGLSPAQAWKTVAKVNNSMALFAPADRILFKYGETWTGTTLSITVSGVNGKPIYFGAYGDARDGYPTIDGNDLVECIQVINQSQLTFEHIYAYQGFNSGFQFNYCSYMRVHDCWASDCGNDNLIFITGCAFCEVRGGRFFSAYPRLGTTIITGIEIADDCHDILIDGVESYSNGTVAGNGFGISIHDHAGTRMPYNITVIGANCYGNKAHGILVYKQDDTNDTDRNIDILDCNTYDNTQDGLRVEKSGSATNYPNGIKFQGCKSRGNTRYGIYISGDNVDVFNCIFTENQNIISNAVNPTVYNCFFYITAGAGWWNLWVQSARTENLKVKNCIIGGGDNTIQMVYVGAGATDGADVNYNQYVLPNSALNRWYWDAGAVNYAGWQAAGMDANSPAPKATMPLFRDYTNGDFRLRADATERNSGVDVGLQYRPPSPDIGYKEYRPFKIIEI